MAELIAKATVRSLATKTKSDLEQLRYSVNGMKYTMNENFEDSEKHWNQLTETVTALLDENAQNKANISILHEALAALVEKVEEMEEAILNGPGSLTFEEAKRDFEMATVPRPDLPEVPLDSDEDEEEMCAMVLDAARKSRGTVHYDTVEEFRAAITRTTTELESKKQK